MSAPLLRPTNPIAPRVLLPGDPGRALALAQALLEAPLMANHHRGLWGYTGTAADGAPLTVQATGVGGPSAAAVVGELAGHGVSTAIRVGTAWGDAHPVGTLVAVRSALAHDGTSRALGSGGVEHPDAELHAALVAAVGVEEDVASTDLPGPVPAGAALVDRSTATVLAVARLRGVRAAAVLAVPDAAGDAPVEALAAAASAALGLPARG